MADNIQYSIGIPETYEKDGEMKTARTPVETLLPITVAILPLTFPNTWPPRAGWCYSRRFHMENARDEFGNKFFMERRTDHTLILLGIAGSKNEAWELRLDHGLKNEMK